MQTKNWWKCTHLKKNPRLTYHAKRSQRQLSSCFLIYMKDDSIEGIYGTLKECAVISKSAGGIGVSVHNICATGSYIRGTNGTSNSIDQRGGKRKVESSHMYNSWGCKSMQKKFFFSIRKSLVEFDEVLEVCYEETF
ncbi:hypothetical protein HN51_059220 [Arachis hypogaea]